MKPVVILLSPTMYDFVVESSNNDSVTVSLNTSSGLQGMRNGSSNDGFVVSTELDTGIRMIPARERVKWNILTHTIVILPWYRKVVPSSCGQ